MVNYRRLTTPELVRELQEQLDKSYSLVDGECGVEYGAILTREELQEIINRLRDGKPNKLRD